MIATAPVGCTGMKSRINWRIVYTIAELDNIIDILAIRKRPPYDYGDLATLLKSLG